MNPSKLDESPSSVAAPRQKIVASALWADCSLIPFQHVSLSACQRLVCNPSVRAMSDFVPFHLFSNGVTKSDKIGHADLSFMWRRHACLRVPHTATRRGVPLPSVICHPSSVIRHPSSGTAPRLCVLCASAFRPNFSFRLLFWTLGCSLFGSPFALRTSHFTIGQLELSWKLAVSPFGHFHLFLNGVPKSAKKCQKMPSGSPASATASSCSAGEVAAGRMRKRCRQKRKLVKKR